MGRKRFFHKLINKNVVMFLRISSLKKVREVRFLPAPLSRSLVIRTESRILEAFKVGATERATSEKLGSAAAQKIPGGRVPLTLHLVLSPMQRVSRLPVRVPNG